MPALEPGLIHERDKPEKLAQLQPTWALNSEWCRIRAHPAHIQSLRWNDCAFVLFFVRVLFYFIFFAAELSESLTPTTMMTLPCLSPTATADAVVSLEVFSVVMISRSCILSTGEK